MITVPQAILYNQAKHVSDLHKMVREDREPATIEKLEEQIGDTILYYCILLCWYKELMSVPHNTERKNPEGYQELVDVAKECISKGYLTASWPCELREVEFSDAYGSLTGHIVTDKPIEKFTGIASPQGVTSGDTK